MQDLLSFPAEVKGNLSFDKLTILVFSPSLSFWGSDSKDRSLNERRINKMFTAIENNLDLDPDFSNGVRSDLFLHHFRTVDGIDIQFGSVMPRRKKITDEVFLAAFGSSDDVENGFMYRYLPNEYAFRLEFNPNSTSLDSLFPVLNALRKNSSSLSSELIRVARIDIAVDYDTSLLPGLVLCQGMRKGFCAYGSSGIESLYFGSRHSKFMFRLYNKRQEIFEKDGVDLGFDRWRLELESKESFFLAGSLPDFRKVFNRVSFVDGAESSSDWILDLIRQKAVSDGLESVLKMMPKSTAIRYRRFFRDQNSRRIEPPVSTFDREFDSKFQNLRFKILRSFGFC